MTADVDVFIIGAGPAGLTAAYCLTESSPSVQVIEKDPIYVGGISRTVRHKNFLFDVGGHRFFSKSKEVLDLWQNILGCDDFIKRPRLSRIIYGGKYYAYPLRAYQALSNLGILTSAACVLSYAYAKIRPVAPARTFHDWVRNRFGEKLFSIFFKTYTEKVWGLSCDEISADWAAQRIGGIDLRVVLLNALRRAISVPGKPKAGDPSVKTLIEHFQYPRLGPGMMWEAAARKIMDRGGRLAMGRTLQTLRHDAKSGLWTVTAVTSDGQTEAYTARHIVSSAPIAELLNALDPRPASLLQASALRYRDFITVALVVRKQDVFPDNWIYVHDPTVKVGRVQNFRSWSPDMAPAGMTCLGLEYFCFEGDRLWQSSDAELVALAKREIAQIGLIDPDAVVDACVVRQPKAYPVYDDAYSGIVAVVRAELEASYPTLHLVGRNGMHKYNNQDHSMMTAMLTVRNIQAGERVYNVWDVNEDAEYHEIDKNSVGDALRSGRLTPRRIDNLLLKNLRAAAERQP
ncbi:MAG: NAD(P)/FAD-dependent oxidoreductase [Bradyrhizobium sp.]|uniref:NAD(P)/FAD-dependent oxidoreductase n=1 Tax=Bradyrhizobium sp. TaxID=376 RepID=UPI0012199AEB|nr:NAD(P)/FAD-dependent oxidoreductase [Bradyrhizobium sp.]THD64545.1 MAG: NAD(P)/FAD-dependent oxidoreductase [Bradyrhizobium sp.]